MKNGNVRISNLKVTDDLNKKCFNAAMRQSSDRKGIRGEGKGKHG